MTKKELLTRAEELRAKVIELYRSRIGAARWRVAEYLERDLKRLEAAPIKVSRRMTRSAGLCIHRTGAWVRKPPCEVKLSLPLLTDPENAFFVDDVILHELAHVLAGPGHGHDVVWKTICRTIGAKPERTTSGMKYGYTEKCHHCGAEVKFGERQHKWWRRGSTYVCPKCRSVLFYERANHEQVTHA